MKIELFMAHLFSTIAIYLGLSHFFKAPDDTIYFVTSTVMALDIFLLVWAIQRIFFKKSIAFATSVVVFKYAFLMFLYVRFVGQLTDHYSFVVGLITLMPTLLLFSLRAGHYDWGKE